MRIKYLLVANLFALGLSLQPAVADGTPADQPQFSSLDIAMMFERDGEDKHLAALSVKEMKETEGALNPYGAIIGGVGGGLGYTFNSYIGDQPWSLSTAK